MNSPSLPIKRDVRRAFGAAAARYDDHAFLQREVADRLLARLAYVKIDPARVLDMGCGTGYVTHELRKHYPRAQVIALDLAAEMLRHAAAAYRAASGAYLTALFKRVRPALVCADAEAMPFADACLDMIVSNLALQWCDPQTVSREAARTLRPNGLFIFTTFGPDTLKELRAAFSRTDGGNHVNRFVDMHDIGDLLVHAGFADPVMDQETITLTYTELRKLLVELKGIGAHNVLPDRSRGLMGKSRWQRMVSAYEDYRVDGRLPATYEVVYGHAWMPAFGKRQDMAGQKAIPLKEFKRMLGSSSS